MALLPGPCVVPGVFGVPSVCLSPPACSRPRRPSAQSYHQREACGHPPRDLGPHAGPSPSILAPPTQGTCPSLHFLGSVCSQASYSLDIVGGLVPSGSFTLVKRNKTEVRVWIRSPAEFPHRLPRGFVLYVESQGFLHGRSILCEGTA